MLAQIAVLPKTTLMACYKEVLSTTGPAFTPNGLSEQCKSLLAAAPSDYKEFINACNGGYPSEKHCFIDVSDRITGGDVCIAEYFSFSPDIPELNISHYLSVYEGRLPEGTIPIARDEFGNLILLGEHRSKTAVYFWDHEREDLEDFGNVEFLAESFSHLLSLLREEPLD